MLSIELGTEILKQGTKLKLSGAERITDMIIEKKEEEEVKNNTAPMAPMPSIRSISAARSSHSTIYIQLRLVG